MSTPEEIRPQEDHRTIDPFILIGEVIESHGSISEPIEIAENVHLKLADDQYISAIKQHMLPFFLLSGIENYILHEYKPGAGNRMVPLEKENWQYWIITHTNFLKEENLALSIELAEIGLTPVLDVTGPQGFSRHLNPQIASSYYQDRLSYDLRTVDETVIKNIKSTRALLDEFSGRKNEFYFIDKAIKDFVNLKELHKKSPFRVIAIFSIIELLITNRGVSISHQLRTKIPLLNRRFDLPLDFFAFFSGPDTLTEEKIIDKMYQYRSDIAHGNMTRFESALKILHSEEKTVEFLYLLLKRLVRYSLSDPQLIADLKQC